MKKFVIKDLVKVHWLGFTEKGMIVGSLKLIKKSYGSSKRYLVEMQDGARERVVPRIITKRRFKVDET